MSKKYVIAWNTGGRVKQHHSSRQELEESNCRSHSGHAVLPSVAPHLLAQERLLKSSTQISCSEVGARVCLAQAEQVVFSHSLCTPKTACSRHRTAQSSDFDAITTP